MKALLITGLQKTAIGGQRGLASFRKSFSDCQRIEDIFSASFVATLSAQKLRLINLAEAPPYRAIP